MRYINFGDITIAIVNSKFNIYYMAWTNDKNKEYRKLKNSGYTHEQLKEHFGDDIYLSKKYTKGASVLNFLQFVNEIKITPLKTEYTITKHDSLFYKNEKDIICIFESKNVEYALIMMVYQINEIFTYNVIFSTKIQYEQYENELKKYLQKGYVTNEERDHLKDIFEKATNYHNLFNVMKSLSYIIFDIKHILKYNILSIGVTDIETKINLYRSIIKDSFTDIKETEIYDQGNHKYFLYNI